MSQLDYCVVLPQLLINWSLLFAGGGGRYDLLVMKNAHFVNCNLP